MARQRDYELLAKLKVRKEETEKKIKEVQNRIFADNPEAEMDTSYGLLNLQTRQTYNIPDNKELIENSTLTTEMFLAHAKIPPGKLKELITKKKFHELVDQGVVLEEEPTYFYQLQKGKISNLEQQERERKREKSKKVKA
jgi:hypothetical protein